MFFWKSLTNSSSNLHTSRFRSFLVLPSFGWFFYLVSNILSRIADVYYSWEYIVNISASIKTGIVSAASKKGDYI